MKNPLIRGAVLFLLLSMAVSCATARNYSENLQPPALAKEAVEAAPKIPSEIPKFNIPIVVNNDVDSFIRHFQTSHRRHFERWLARSTRYIPLMQKILYEAGLPTDLVYLAMIESGFNNEARSFRNAVGPWQFIKATGQRYGLQSDWWIDERRDPIKATIAASQYLKELYTMFDSWFLAAAGYNAGENKIKRAIRKFQTQDFWEMRNYSYLKRETKQYIPKLIAATLIAKNPEKYGFDNIPYHEPLSFDIVTVDGPVDLKRAAKITDVSYQEIRKLNPELRRWCTPPHMKTYPLKIPAGTKDKFLARYDQIAPKNKTLFYTHHIQRGDTLYALARRYDTQIQPIIELNNILSPNALRPGQRLIIPVRANSPAKESPQET